jgi:hypothetical protein
MSWSPESDEVTAPTEFESRASERGMATAELLGNAALGIAALVAIWAVLQAVGLDVMEWIRAQLQV